MVSHHSRVWALMGDLHFLNSIMGLIPFSMRTTALCLWRKVVFPEGALHTSLAWVVICDWVNKAVIAFQQCITMNPRPSQHQRQVHICVLGHRQSQQLSRQLCMILARRVLVVQRSTNKMQSVGLV